MKNKHRVIKGILFFFLWLTASLNTFSQVVSNNAVLVVPEGAHITVMGDLINKTDGDIKLNGVINLKGDWINHKTNLQLEGEVRFISNPGQKINGPEITTFNDVRIIPGSRVVLGDCVTGCKYVTISGTFTNENGADGFTMRPGASLLHQSASVAATIERDIAGDEWAWHMLSSPVTAQSITSGFDDGSFYAWHEPAQTWVSYTNQSIWPTWDDVNNVGGVTNIFHPYFGYLAAYPFEDGNPQTKVFSGHMNQGEYSFALQRLAHPDDQYEGFNMVGNPYPSSIDWKAESGWGGRNNLQTPDSTISPAGYNMWIWNDDIGNYGAHNSASTSDYAHNGVSRFIPPMQAFWVRAENHGATLTMNNSIRMHSNQEWLKSQKDSPGLLQLAISSEANRYSDEIIIEFGHQNDRGGAEKMFSMYQEAPGLYSKKHNENWSISFLTDINTHPVVPVGFKAGVKAIYTLSSTGTGFFEQVILEDLHTGTLHDLTQYDSYHFSAGPGDPQDRFLLHFMTVGTDQQYVAKPIVYHANAMLHVVNPWQTKADIQVYDAGGRLVQYFKAPTPGMHRFGFQPQPGIYLIRVLGEKQVIVRKVIIM